MSTQALKRAVEDVLVQGNDLLASVTAAKFTAVAPQPFGASIGQHYRHILDHFICVADGLISGSIDYDGRERDRELESNIDAARTATARLLELFTSLSDDTFRRACLVRYTVGYRDDQSQVLESDFARETAYCVSHSIHHFAIMRLLCTQFEVSLPEEFGVAPSTLKHRAAQAVAN